MSARPRTALAPLVLALVVTACTEAGQVEVVIRTDPPELADSLAWVQVSLVRDCEAVELGGAPVDAVRTVEVSRGAPAPALGEVARGDYGLYARGRDPACEVRAASCEPVRIGGDTRSIEVTLESRSGSGCAAGESCDDGTCRASMDGGPGDAPADAPGVDAASDADAAPDAGAAWWDTSWSRRLRIEPDPSRLRERLEDFVVLVVLDSTRVDYASFDGGGADMRFVASDGTTVLPHEVERWDSSGNSFVWVRMPVIEIDGSTHMWLYFGNESATARERPGEVWSGYGAVYHFAEEAASGAEPRLRDHGPMGLHLTTSGGFTADSLSPGAVGLSWSVSQTVYSWHDVDADGVYETSDDAAEAFQVGVDDFSLCIWARASSARDEQVIGLKLGGGTTAHWGIGYSGGQLSCQLADGTGSSFLSLPDDAADDTWRMICCVSDRDVGQRLYVDGSLVDIDPTPLTGPVDNDRPFTVNGRDWHTVDNKGISGALDEVRFAKTARSDGWIEAQHLSQTDALLEFETVELRP